MTQIRTLTLSSFIASCLVAVALWLVLAPGSAQAAFICSCPKADWISDAEHAMKYAKFEAAGCSCNCPNPGKKNSFLTCNAGQPIFCTPGAKIKAMDEHPEVTCQCADSPPISCSGGNTNIGDNNFLKPKPDVQPPTEAQFCPGFWHSVFVDMIGFTAVPKLTGANSNVGLGNPEKKQFISGTQMKCQEECPQCMQYCDHIWKNGLDDCKSLGSGVIPTGEHAGKSMWQMCTDTWQKALLECLQKTPWDSCRLDQNPAIAAGLAADKSNMKQILSEIAEKEAEECIRIQPLFYRGAFIEGQKH